MSSRPLSTHSPHSSVSIFIAPSKNSLFQIKCPIQLIKLWQCPMTNSSLVTVGSLSMNIGLTMRSHWNEQHIYLNEVEPLTGYFIIIPLRMGQHTQDQGYPGLCSTQQTWSIKISNFPCLFYIWTNNVLQFCMIKKVIQFWRLLTCLTLSERTLRGTWTMYTFDWVCAVAVFYTFSD